MTETMTTAEYRRQFIDPAGEPENPYKSVNDSLDQRLFGKVPDVENAKNEKVRFRKYSSLEKTERKHEEDDITMQLVQYLHILMVQGKVVEFSHIPQETFTKSWAIKSKNTKMGVRSGVPDMLIVFRHKVLFLELKRVKGGVVSESQQKWLACLAAAGVVARVARGFDEALQIIDEVLLLE